MNRRLFYLIGLIAATMMSCENEPHLNEQPINTNESKSLEEFFANHETPAQVFTERNEVINEVVTANGAVFNFPNDAFADSNSVTVTGEIELRITEIYRKSEFIFSDVPTVTNDNRILKSEGAFHLEATQNGDPLELDYRMEFRFTGYSSAVDDSMELYYGLRTQQGFQWANIQDRLNGNGVNLTPWLANGRYMIHLNPNTTVAGVAFANLGWLNCDDVVSDTLPTTSITISINGEFDLVNTAAYIVFNDINSVMRLDSYSDSTFVSPSNIPVTFNVTYVVITVNEQNSYLATKATKVEPNHSVELIPVVTPEEEIVSRLQEFD